MTIAEIYETELVDLPKACEAYTQAAEWFQGEESSRYEHGDATQKIIDNNINLKYVFAQRSVVN